MNRKDQRREAMRIYYETGDFDEVQKFLKHKNWRSTIHYIERALILYGYRWIIPLHTESKVQKRRI